LVYDHGLIYAHELCRNRLRHHSHWS
jgi:hypothetical protein